MVKCSGNSNNDDGDDDDVGRWAVNKSVAPAVAPLEQRVIAAERRVRLILYNTDCGGLHCRPCVCVGGGAGGRESGEHWWSSSQSTAADGDGAAAAANQVAFVVRR